MWNCDGLFVCGVGDMVGMARARSFASLLRAPRLDRHEVPLCGRARMTARGSGEECLEW
jgi:hypothetical protein